MEDDSDPEMTLADISAGEQSGAFLRGLVKTNGMDEGRRTQNTATTTSKL